MTTAQTPTTLLEQLGKQMVEVLTNRTNRSKGQTMFLLELLNGDYNKLLELEERLKNNFLYYCPADMEEVEKVLAMKNDKCLLDLSDLKTTLK